MYINGLQMFENNKINLTCHVRRAPAQYNRALTARNIKNLQEDFRDRNQSKHELMNKDQTWTFFQFLHHCYVRFHL